MALTCLHEEWHLCVQYSAVEVLLDTNFNACLPDFAHTHLVDHENVELTTMMAGTIGYMAPGNAPPWEKPPWNPTCIILELCGRRLLDISFLGLKWLAFLILDLIGIWLGEDQRANIIKTDVLKGLD